MKNKLTALAGTAIVVACLFSNVSVAMYISQSGSAGYSSTSRALSAPAMNYLTHTVTKCSSDNAKCITLKRGISGHGVSAAQVRLLMDCLAFESNKIELARFSHSYVVDPQDFDVVSNGLTSLSSYAILREAIGR